jgi:hypothetical protein
MFLRDPQDFLRHFREVRIFEHEAAKRIASAGVETGRNDDEIRRELSFDFMKGVDEGLTVIARGGAARERNIQRGSFCPCLPTLTREPVPG